MREILLKKPLKYCNTHSPISFLIDTTVFVNLNTSFTTKTSIVLPLPYTEFTCKLDSMINGMNYTSLPLSTPSMPSTKVGVTNSQRLA